MENQQMALLDTLLAEGGEGTLDERAPKASASLRRCNGKVMN
jgi:hypothetical protein